MTDLAGCFGHGRPKKIEVQPGKFVYPHKSACPKEFQEAFIRGFNRDPEGYTSKPYTRRHDIWVSWYKRGQEKRELADWNEMRGVDMDIFYAKEATSETKQHEMDS